MTVYGQESANATVKPQKSSFQLYPNPAMNDVIYITTENQGDKHIVIYDIFGEIVLRDRITSTALNITDLVAGVYVLQVIENNETMTRKLVVK